MSNEVKLDEVKLDDVKLDDVKLDEVKPKEQLKKNLDAGKYAIKNVTYESHVEGLAIKNIPLMSTKSLIVNLDSKRVPDAFKKLCKAELDGRIAARAAKAKATK